jgi:hypothetical protein
MMETITYPNQAPSQPDAPPAELKLLDLLTGKWSAVGESMPDTPVPGRMEVSDTYEWYPGGFFLLNRGELKVDGKEVNRHLWIFGYDSESGTWPVHAFDNRGNFRLYEGRWQGRRLTLAGKWERGWTEYSEDGTSFTSHWEFTKDGNHWLPLCELQGKREK